MRISSCSQNKYSGMLLPDSLPERNPHVFSEKRPVKNVLFNPKELLNIRSVSVFSVKTLKWIGYTALLLTGLAKTGASQILLNEAGKKLNWVPVPSAENYTQQIEGPFKFISLSSTESDLLDKTIWGLNPDESKLFQGDRPNCQVMAAIQAQYLTPKNLKSLKSAIEVKNYDLSENNFFIDTIVHLNGHEVNVNWNDLEKWMGVNGITPSQSKDGALAIPILTYALEKILTDHYECNFPPTIPSCAPILLTGKDYSVIGISPFALNMLSDNELENILRQAPESTILVASYGSFDNFLSWLEEKLLEENKSFKFLPYSHENVTKFRKQNINRVNKIMDPLRNEPKITLERNNLSSQSSYGIASAVHKNIDFPKNHLYVVKSFRDEDKTVSLIDSHGVCYPPLPLHEFREKMWCLATESNNVKPLTYEALKGYFILLLGIYGLKTSSKFAVKRLQT